MEFPKQFYVERWKPDKTSTVLTASDPVDIGNAKKLFEDAKDFQIKGDYMFATKQSKEVSFWLIANCSIQVIFRVMEAFTHIMTWLW